MVPIYALIIGIGGGAAVGFVAAFVIRKFFVEKKIDSAKKQAKEILEDAIKTAESTKKESISLKRKRTSI